jgi:hypothetical protein
MKGKTMATIEISTYRELEKSLQPGNRDLKEILDEYRAHVKAIEFGERTIETMSEWEEWQQTNAEHLASLGIDSGQMFDQIYEELEHLFYPRAEHRETIHQWHRDHSAQLLAQGLYSYEEVFYAVDDLKETYRNSDSNGLRESLTKLASIPLMTTEVMQEIIYEACRDLPAGAVIGLTKVKISAP